MGIWIQNKPLAEIITIKAFAALLSLFRVIKAGFYVRTHIEKQFIIADNEDHYCGPSSSE